MEQFDLVANYSCSQHASLLLQHLITTTLVTSFENLSSEPTLNSSTILTSALRRRKSLNSNGLLQYFVRSHALAAVKHGPPVRPPTRALLTFDDSRLVNLAVGGVMVLGGMIDLDRPWYNVATS